jgi:DNA polymerase III epsilon subunit-like protein
MILFFDTETTGLPPKRTEFQANYHRWPRLVQLAYLVFDVNGKRLASGNHIIRPEGFIIPPDASRIHGITQRMAEKDGEPLNTVLRNFLSYAETARILVAHNMEFDLHVIRAELLRRKIHSDFHLRPQICTMKTTTDFCNLYRKKWPKLTELHYRLFGTDFKNAHNALSDVEAAARCFFELAGRGFYSNLLKDYGLSECLMPVSVLDNPVAQTHFSTGHGATPAKNSTGHPASFLNRLKKWLGF